VKVLIIDDNKDDSTLMELALKTYAKQHDNGICFDVETITDWQAAVMAALSAPPEVIITDYVMPGKLSWPEIFSHIREVSDAPVIVVSGVRSDDAGMLAIELGSSDYIDKRHLDWLGHAVHRAWLIDRAHRERAEVSDSIVKAVEESKGR